MASALGYFDRIYVINLPHRTDRRREIGEQLARLGLALDRPPVQLFAAVRPDAPGPFPTIGTRGCFLSHLGVLRDAVRANHSRILILEDDVDFVADFETRMRAVAERLATQPWGVFYGGHRIDDARWRPAADEPLQVAEPDMGVTTAHFIAFSRPAIHGLVPYLERMLARPPGDPAGGPMHVDGAYSWYRGAHPDCVTLVSTRQLAEQRPSRTDIHALRWFDRLPLLRDLAQWARRRRKGG